MKQSQKTSLSNWKPDVTACFFLQDEQSNSQSLESLRHKDDYKQSDSQINFKFDRQRSKTRPKTQFACYGSNEPRLDGQKELVEGQRLNEPMASYQQQRQTPNSNCKVILTQIPKYNHLYRSSTSCQKGRQVVNKLKASQGSVHYPKKVFNNILEAQDWQTEQNYAPSDEQNSKNMQKGASVSRNSQQACSILNYQPLDVQRKSYLQKFKERVQPKTTTLDNRIKWQQQINSSYADEGRPFISSPAQNSFLRVKPNTVQDKHRKRSSQRLGLHQDSQNDSFQQIANFDISTSTLNQQRPNPHNFHKSKTLQEMLIKQKQKGQRKIKMTMGEKDFAKQVKPPLLINFRGTDTIQLRDKRSRQGKLRHKNVYKSFTAGSIKIGETFNPQDMNIIKKLEPIKRKETKPKVKRVAAARSAYVKASSVIPQDTTTQIQNTCHSHYPKCSDLLAQTSLIAPVLHASKQVNDPQIASIGVSGGLNNENQLKHLEEEDQEQKFKMRVEFSHKKQNIKFQDTSIFELPMTPMKLKKRGKKGDVGQDYSPLFYTAFQQKEYSPLKKWLSQGKQQKLLL